MPCSVVTPARSMSWMTGRNLPRPLVHAPYSPVTGSTKRIWTAPPPLVLRWLVRHSYVCRRGILYRVQFCLHARKLGLDPDIQVA